MACMGLPMCRHESKRTPLTRPKSLYKSVGMTRIFSTSEREKVAQEMKAVALALLGVELDGVDVPSAHRRREASAVGGGGRHVLFGAADEVVAVDEVEVDSRLDSVEQRGVARGDDLVPANVRDTPVGLGRDQAPHVAFDPPQPGRLAALVAARRQELHPETDSEEGGALSAHLLLEDFVETAL